MTTFKSWYYNKEGANNHKENMETGAIKFSQATDVEIDSLKAFISWLMVNRYITGIIKSGNRKKPVSIMALSDEKKVLYLVKNVKNIKDLAKEYNYRIGNFESPHDDKSAK